ncbi:Uncharacterised protein [Shigella sonnei]|nr:Uncharacterised protein [Shigella sonnei]
MVSDWHRDAGIGVHPAGADDLYLRTGVQQRADAGFTESGRSGHAARHLADGDDRADCRTGKPGVRHSAGLAGDAL